MSERKLVTIEKIEDIRPIVGADAIEVAIVRSWPVVIKKDQFNVGDWVLYFEIDSFLPIRPEFEFLRKGCYKKLPSGVEGFRLKTIKLRGQVSQGLLMPLLMLNDVDPRDEMVIGISSTTGGKIMQLGPYDDAIIIEEGADVTEFMGVFKYEPPIPACLAGTARGNFPSFLRKTDEERIQNMKSILTTHAGVPFYVAEKLEGSSATYYLNDGVFGVCSRNLDLEEIGENSFWQAARELQIEEKMRQHSEASDLKNFALQGELIGNGIQGNIYNLSGITIKFFNVFDIDRFDYLPYNQFKTVIEALQLETVPVLYESFLLPETVDELLTLADGKSTLNPKVNREGLVFRTLDESRVSFKAISNAYLLNEK